DEVDGNSRLTQRFYDTNVRETARASTRQHEPDTAPRQHPRHTLNVVSTCDVVMRDVRILFEPTGGRTPYEVTVVDENELRSLRRKARAALSRQYRPAANFPPRTR